MTVSSDTNRSGPYAGNGVTTAFNYDFRVISETHLSVRLTNVAGVEATLSLDGGDYTVSGVGDAAGGQATLATAPAEGEWLVILRAVPFTQETDLENQGEYYAETVEAGFDLAAMRDQQQQEQINRALRIPTSDDLDAVELPVAALRAGKTIVFDGDGNPAVSVDDFNDQLANVTAQAVTATTAAGAAAGSAAVTLGLRNSAEKWAQEGEDVLVNDGTNPEGFSSFHWAQKSAGSAGSAADSAVLAANASQIPAGGDTGQVLAKASATDRDAEWIDPPASDLTVVEVAGTTYTASLSDVGKLIRFTSATAVTLTLADLPAGTPLNFEQGGAGAVTVEADTGLTKTHPGQTNVTIGEGSLVFATKDTATNWAISGGLAPAESWADAAVYATETTPGVVRLATQTITNAGTNSTDPVVPSRLKAHPGVSKAWARFTIAGVIDYSYGVSSIVDDGVGEATVNLTTSLPTGSAVFHVDVFHATLPRKAQIELPSATAPSFRCYDGASTLADPTRWYFSAFAGA